jgi:hypothetical protein
MECKKIIRLVLLTTFLIMGIWSQAAEAKPDFFMQIPDRYDEKSCVLCHTAPPELNSFGLEFRNILQKTGGDAVLAFQKLETVEPNGHSSAHNSKADNSKEVVAPPSQSGSSSTTDSSSTTESASTMELVVLGEVHRGEQVELQATLLDNSGKPVGGALISFVVPASLFIDADMHITQVRTNAGGQATIRYTPKLEGDIQVIARTEGGLNYQPTEAAVKMTLEKGITLYNTDWRVRAPFMSPLLIVLAVAIIWSAYAVTAKQVIGIWREGRLEKYEHKEMQEKTSVG